MSGSFACRKIYAHGKRCGLPKGHEGEHELSLCIAEVVDPDQLRNSAALTRPCRFRQAPGSEFCSVHEKAFQRAMGA